MNSGRAVRYLRREKSWMVSNIGSDEIKVVKTFGKKVKKSIEFRLICSKTGIYIKHPNYIFQSTVSHFCSSEKDVRLSLNKNFLESIIKNLKKVGLWKDVINKDFLKVNLKNSKSNKAAVNKELKFLLK